MKRFYFTGIATVFTAMIIVLAVSTTASAHVLKTDNQIGAVFHIEPDDNPESGTPVTYQLVFNDTSGRFKLTDCTCTVTLQNNQGTVKSETIQTNRTHDVHQTVTFPEADVYTLIVRGEPKQAGAFQSFRLSYSIRVTDGTVQFQPVPVLLWAGLGSAVTLALLAAFKEERDNSQAV